MPHRITRFACIVVTLILCASFGMAFAAEPQVVTPTPAITPAEVASKATILAPMPPALKPEVRADLYELLYKQKALEVQFRQLAEQQKSVSDQFEKASHELKAKLEPLQRPGFELDEKLAWKRITPPAESPVKAENSVKKPDTVAKK